MAPPPGAAQHRHAGPAATDPLPDGVILQDGDGRCHCYVPVTRNADFDWVPASRLRGFRLGTPPGKDRSKAASVKPPSNSALFW